MAAQQRIEPPRRQVHHEQAGGGHVIAVEKFPAGAPVPHTVTSLAPRCLGLMEFSDQGGDDNSRDDNCRPGRTGWWASRREFLAVLPVIAPACLDACDLGQTIGPVGRFQPAGQKIFFLQRLRRSKS